MATLVARRARGPRIGVTLAAEELCATIRRAGQPRAVPWRVSLTPLNGDGSSWPGLTDALRHLARDAGVTGGRLTVALMPPLAEARAVTIPQLSDDDTQQLLARSASKYFVGARGANVVGAVRHDRSSTTGTVAAAANARLVGAIEESARAAGWTLETVIPVEAAWAAAAASFTSRGRGAAQLIIAHHDRTDLITVDGGRLRALRRFRAGAADAGLIADAFSGDSSRAVIVGNAERRHELTRALSSHGIAVESAPGVNPDIADHPDLLAAAHATHDAAPALLTDTMRAARRAFAARVTTRIAIAAGVLLASSLAFEWWGLRRELAFVRAERAALSPQIATTLVGRTTVEVAFRQLAVLAAEERAAPRWSATLANLSEALPPDAFLTGFRGRSDSVAVDGLATRAARVFDAIEQVPGLTGVRSAGPVRIEAPLDDGPPLERFAIAATVAPRTPAKAPVAPKPPVAEKRQ